MVTRDEIIDWFKNYRFFSECVDKIDQTVKMLDKETCRIMNESGIETQARIESLKNMRKIFTHNAAEAEKDINFVIDDLRDDREKEIMKLLYIDGFTFDYVSMITHISIRQIYRIRDKIADRICEMHNMTDTE